MSWMQRGPRGTKSKEVAMSQLYVDRTIDGKLRLINNALVILHSKFLLLREKVDSSNKYERFVMIVIKATLQ